jgi:hypothetical protein
VREFSAAAGQVTGGSLRAGSPARKRTSSGPSPFLRSSSSPLRGGAPLSVPTTSAISAGRRNAGIWSGLAGVAPVEGHPGSAVELGGDDLEVGGGVPACTDRLPRLPGGGARTHDPGIMSAHALCVVPAWVNAGSRGSVRRRNTRLLHTEDQEPLIHAQHYGLLRVSSGTGRRRHGPWPPPRGGRRNYLPAAVTTSASFPASPGQCAARPRAQAPRTGAPLDYRRPRQSELPRHRRGARTIGNGQTSLLRTAGRRRA